MNFMEILGWVKAILELLPLAFIIYLHYYNIKSRKREEAYKDQLRAMQKELMKLQAEKAKAEKRSADETAKTQKLIRGMTAGNVGKSVC